MRLRTVCLAALFIGLSCGCSTAQAVVAAAASSSDDTTEREADEQQRSGDDETDESNDDEVDLPVLDFDNQVDGELPKPTKTEEVTVVDAKPGSGNLPDGLYYEDGAPRAKTDYPTRENPHRRIGLFRMGSHETKSEHTKDEFYKAFLEKGAYKGADFIVVDYDFSTAVAPAPRAYAYRLSDAEPGDIQRDTDKLLAEEATAPKEDGYGEKLLAETRSLSKFEWVSLPGERGRCYWVTFALGPDAEFNRNARRRLDFRFTHIDGHIDGSVRPNFDPDETEDEDDHGTLNRHARSGNYRIGCPFEDATLGIKLVTQESSKPDAQNVPKLGSGEIEVRVYGRNISESEVAKEEREWEKQQEEMKEFIKEENHKNCQKCEPKKNLCTRDFATCDPYITCLERVGVSYQWCREHGY